MSLALLAVRPAAGLEIRVDDSGQSVATRQYLLQLLVTDALPVRRVTVELNGKALPVPAFAAQPVVRLELPALLQLGPNLIGVRAETDRYRSSALVSIDYDGGDDACPPTLRVVHPAGTEERTADSTLVVRGYAYDDVHVAAVTVEGRPTQPWSAGAATTGTKDLVVEPLGCPAADTAGFASAPLPLAVGWNTLRVEAQDQKGRTGLQELRVFREPPFGGDRWAVVVGVSDYRPGVQSLQYADDDARLVYDFLLSPRGGGFAPEKTRLLLNADATNQALRDALFVFLRQAKKEDLVLIYFSGHGASEPGRPDLVYLLTHDADPDRLPSTAFAMDDVSTALNRYVSSERVLIVADACHSGAILGLPTMRSLDDESALLNRYLQELSKSAPGRAVFTASEAREQSREGEQWGGGHGVFTYHFVEGLRGKADRDGNGIVTLGEAIEYTRNRVQEDTQSRQHPDPGGEYDRNLPMAVIRANQ
jgi:hypothetical protein